MRVFQEVVEEDDEFAHDGGEGDFGGFAVFAEALIEGGEADAFLASLPVAGVDGTLEKRMKGTAAEGNVRAKTGGMRWAVALSGYVTTAAGERLVFSLMLNRHRGTAERPARAELDKIAVMLANYGGRS